ncbi:MAG: hypothetical protein H3C30_02310 [Candidatus Hydrogenedentes bacterium]|nr:hypothetical protein [Candidatus Hydrogenedentota bacterium]
MPTAKEIWDAGWAGDVDKLRQLAAEGADFNEQDEEGNTPFNTLATNLCAWRKPFRYDVVSVLLECGADPNITDNDGEGALTTAMLSVDVPMLRMLLEAGADPNKFQGYDESESFLDWGIWDYELLHCQSCTEKPTEEEQKDVDLMLAFLERVATKYNCLPPEHLLLLRSFGARSKEEPA